MKLRRRCRRLKQRAAKIRDQEERAERYTDRTISVGADNHLHP